MSDSLWPHGLQHARLPCLSPTPGAYSNSCLSSWRCHPNISSSVVPFSSCLQPFPASGSFPMSQLFTSIGSLKNTTHGYIYIFIYKNKCVVCTHPYLSEVVIHSWIYPCFYQSINIFIYVIKCTRIIGIEFISMIAWEWEDSCWNETRWKQRTL